MATSSTGFDLTPLTTDRVTALAPGYVRVTNLANGRSVVVRVNDRGPFHAGRIIDLSYTAALKLGYVEAGSAQVEVEVLTPGGAPTAAAPTAAAPAPVVPAANVDEQKGIFLQLGAFSSRDNAESFRARVQRDLAWMNDAVRVSPAGSLFRLHLGPYASTEDARRIAERIRLELGVAPILVNK